jgi:hypothetical protein
VILTHGQRGMRSPQSGVTQSVAGSLVIRRALSHDHRHFGYRLQSVCPIRPAALRSLRTTVGPPNRHHRIRRSLAGRPVPLSDPCATSRRQPAGGQWTKLRLQNRPEWHEIHARELLEGRPDGGQDLGPYGQHLLVVVGVGRHEVDQIAGTDPPVHRRIERLA